MKISKYGQATIYHLKIFSYDWCIFVPQCVTEKVHNEGFFRGVKCITVCQYLDGFFLTWPFLTWASYEAQQFSTVY